MAMTNVYQVTPRGEVIPREVTGRVIRVQRHGHTYYGNPMKSVHLECASVEGKDHSGIYRISDNSSLVYEIENGEFRDEPHTFVLTRAGRISHVQHTPRKPRTTGYVVLPYGGYPDTESDYVECATRRGVEAQLVDYGWMDNPVVSVYRVVDGESPASVIRELAASHDPYPDWVVERGPRGGVQWNRA